MKKQQSVRETNRNIDKATIGNAIHKAVAELKIANKRAMAVAFWAIETAVKGKLVSNGGSMWKEYNSICSGNGYRYGGLSGCTKDGKNNNQNYISTVNGAMQATQDGRAVKNSADWVIPSFNGLTADVVDKAIKAYSLASHKSQKEIRVSMRQHYKDTKDKALGTIATIVKNFEKIA